LWYVAVIAAVLLLLFSILYQKAVIGLIALILAVWLSKQDSIIPLTPGPVAEKAQTDGKIHD